jgi:hypothetical protein
MKFIGLYLSMYISNMICKNNYFFRNYENFIDCVQDIFKNIPLL